MKTSREITIQAWSGWLMLGLAVIGMALGVALLDRAPIVGAPVLLAGILLLPGLFVVGPNTARVLTLFGRYTGTVREVGFHWVNPFSGKQAVSLRARTLNGTALKVNDKAGNPIEIATVIVWRVHDTAQAVFDVEDCAELVRIQSESALRHLASSYPYDGGHDDEVSLRGSTDLVADRLRAELLPLLAIAGVEVIDARLSHLAYAPEIAGAMLRRQQAAAVVAARQRIVEGAVGMVQLALQQLAEHDVVHLDEERKAAMVSNLLVVLCGETNAQPVVNTGSLYT